MEQLEKYQMWGKVLIWERNKGESDRSKNCIQSLVFSRDFKFILTEGPVKKNKRNLKKIEFFKAYKPMSVHKNFSPIGLAV